MPEPQLDALFQAGIDPDSSHLAVRSAFGLALLEQVRDYVRRSRELVDKHIERAPEDVALMALEHRLMHLETLAYMFHNFGYGLKNGHLFQQHQTSGRCGHPKTVGVTFQRARPLLGSRAIRNSAGTTNMRKLREHVPAFRMQRFNVTNGEYLQFVRQGAPLPHFWVERNGVAFLSRHV